jgi:hypothetical protein
LRPHTRSLREAVEDSAAADSSPSTHPLVARASSGLIPKAESDFETDFYFEGGLSGEPGQCSNLRNLHRLTQTYRDVSGLADDSLLHQPARQASRNSDLRFGAGQPHAKSHLEVHR